MSTIHSRPLADISTLKRLIEQVWHNGELSVITELYDEQYVGHDPYYGIPICGQDEVREQIASMRAAFPDLRFELDDIVIAGDRLAYRYAARGRHLGPLDELPATGRPVTITGIEIIRFGVGGRIAEQWSWWDALGLLRQLGADAD